MGAYPRQEIEDAFAHYREVAARAAASGRWDDWVELFTEDAIYIEHHYGRYEGREAIRKWISETMSTAVNKDMNAFPVRWYVIDEDRGWVVCSVINRMADPGDGSVHEADSWTRLEYAGDGRFSLEEDMYNPNEFATMIAAWSAAKRGG
ncbi:MAG TPA: nuclear transport factor 2 family protein [Acidimicrobiales bacterium]|nr:nuclear transport factor 2 family protein [Acidimicrobiales bacterium]